MSGATAGPSTHCFDAQMKDALRRCEEAAANQYGVISRRQALSLGLSERGIARLLGSGAWSLVHPNTYAINGAPWSWHRDVLAAVLSGGVGASHRTAAALWDCPTFAPDNVEITATKQLRRKGVHVHQTMSLATTELRRRNRIPVTDPERTLIDLGAVVGRDRVEVALDHFLAKQLTTLSRIARRIEVLHGPGWRGTKKLKHLLALRNGHRGSGESPLETKFFQLLRAARLPLPERQVVIKDGDRFIGRVDLAYVEARLIIEVQGYAFHSSRQAWTHDVLRRRELHVLGWRVVEVTEHDLTEGRVAFIKQLKRLLDELSLFI